MSLLSRRVVWGRKSSERPSSPSWIPAQCHPWSYDTREIEKSSSCPVILSLRCATWTAHAISISGQCDKFSARVNDQIGVLEAFSVTGTLSHNFQRPVGTFCPSASEELHTWVHTTLVEYLNDTWIGLCLPSKSCDSFLCPPTSSYFWFATSLMLITFPSAGSSTLTGQKTTSPLSVFHFSPHLGKH